MCVISMENKPVTKQKTEKDHQYQEDEFILNLIDLNAGFDLKEPNGR